MTDRELIWRVYSEYMASGFIKDDTLWAVQDKLKEPVSVADEWKLECIRMLEDIKKLQDKIDELVSR